MINKLNYICSLNNDFFKEIYSLKSKKYRYINQCYLIEGIRFVEEAIKNSSNLKYIIVSESKKDSLIKNLKLDELNFKIFVFSDLLFSKIKQTENAQGIIAYLKMKNNYHKFNFLKGIYFLIDRVQDPGNLGTIIRTAVAVGALGVIIVKGTVDLYNDKVLRATMGSIFKINIYFIEDYSIVHRFLENDFKFVIADSHGEKIYYNEVLTEKIVLVVGNEGNGVSKEIREIPHVNVRIPMSNDLESLNVAQALSIIAFEYVRQSSCK